MKENLKPDDIVLVADQSTPRNSWPLERITKTNIGRDGLVRSAELKTGSITITRPITKLCNLELMELGSYESYHMKYSSWSSLGYASYIVVQSYHIIHHDQVSYVLQNIAMREEYSDSYISWNICMKWSEIYISENYFLWYNLG